MVYAINDDDDDDDELLYIIEVIPMLLAMCLLFVADVAPTVACEFSF